VFGGSDMVRPKSIKEVEYEILKYLMFNETGTFEGMTDLFKSLGGECNDYGHLISSDRAKDKPLQKRLCTAKKNIRVIIGNMLQRRVQYLPETHVNYGIKTWEDSV